MVYGEAKILGLNKGVVYGTLGGRALGDINELSMGSTSVSTYSFRGGEELGLIDVRNVATKVTSELSEVRV